MMVRIMTMTVVVMMAVIMVMRLLVMAVMMILIMMVTVTVLPVWTATTKYHRLSGLNIRHLFFMVLEAGKSKIRVPT